MSVQTVSVACNHCGAPLDVREGTRFVTCTHCGSRLAVHRDGGAAYTEVLDEIRQATRDIAADVGSLRAQGELEALDREWQMRRETLLTRNKDGSTSVPTQGSSVVAGVVAVVFGVGWTVFAATLVRAPLPFALFGLVFAGLGVFGAMSGSRKAAEYASAERTYQQRRAALLAKLERPQAPAGEG